MKSCLFLLLALSAAALVSARWTPAEDGEQQPSGARALTRYSHWSDGQAQHIQLNAQCSPSLLSRMGFLLVHCEQVVFCLHEVHGCLQGSL